MSGTPIDVVGPAHMAGQVRVLYQIAEERARQDVKWGPIQDIPDGTGPERVNLYHEYQMLLEAARMQNDAHQGTWESVLREEFCEAMVESDVAKLRTELIQTAAVCVKWIEHIDARETRNVTD